jgi:hypothetical protein
VRACVRACVCVRACGGGGRASLRVCTRLYRLDEPNVQEVAALRSKGGVIKGDDGPEALAARCVCVFCT